jgi:hypothetical protein
VAIVGTRAVNIALAMASLYLRFSFFAAQNPQYNMGSKLTPLPLCPERPIAIATTSLIRGQMGGVRMSARIIPLNAPTPTAVGCVQGDRASL